MMIVIISITLLYLALIGSFSFGFNKIKVFEKQGVIAKTKFSIIIPFRNEAEKLPALLKSISELNYPKELYELIFVDDESDDDSINFLDTIPIKIGITRTDIKIISNIRKTNSPKKDAISTAIDIAKYDWIVTTDADCVLPKFWLESFDAYIQKHEPKLVVAPVTYSEPKNFIERFQLLDVLSLQGATIGGFGINQPFLCNGANLAYKKALFQSLQGFDGNAHIASGDDVFLLEKALKKDKKSVHYLKSRQAIVTTQAQPNIESLIAQRVRWASKTTAYQNLFGKLAGIIVLLVNTLVICLVVMAIVSLISYKNALYILLIKFYIDLLLIYKSAQFLEQKSVLKTYIPSFFLYPVFSVYVAFLSMFSDYKWKTRTYKK
jgi:glycosyltransferase involved in cell wall biosynthesis